MHLGFLHYVNSASRYFQCCESGCWRTFSYMWSYRRHLEKMHEDENTDNDPVEGPAPSVQNVQMLNVEVEGDQGGEDIEDWDELEQEDLIKNSTSSSLTISL